MECRQQRGGRGGEIKADGGGRREDRVEVEELEEHEEGEGWGGGGGGGSLRL